MNWPVYKLGDLIDVLSGFAFDSKYFNDSAGHKLIRIRDVIRGFSETYYDGEFDEKYFVTEGEILVGMDGEFNMARWGREPALLNQRVCKVTVKDDRLDENYLFHFLPKQLKKIEDATPFVTVKHLSVKKLVDIDIPLPPLAEQQRIAEQLDTADRILRLREQAIAKLDQLAGSVFDEMFSRIDQKVTLSDLADLKRGPFGGALKKEIFVENGLMVYEQRNAILDDCSSGRYFISEEKYSQMREFSVNTNDLIVSCSGTLGRVAIVEEQSPRGIINQALLRIRPHKNVSPIFLKSALESDEVQRQLIAFSHGSGLQNFPPMSIVKAVKITLPPIDLQRKFELIKASVKQKRLTLFRSKHYLETLYKSLQHQSFSVN